MRLLILLALVVVSQSLQLGRKTLVAEVPDAEPISPYAFSYTADAIDGGSSRQESADASGVVRGSYSVISADGAKRIVSYIADENGFRAQVQTNEPGTESKNSADVVMLSSQPPAEEIALKYGPRPQEGLLAVKSELPLALGVKKPVFKTLDIPVKTRLESFLPEVKTFFPTHIESPIKLLSKIQKTPIAFQQKSEIFGQHYESF